MPRYYFHIRTGSELIRDPDGSELPDLEAAVAEARQEARGLLADLLKRGEIVDGQVFEISDETGEVLERLALRSVMRLP